jgi:hypothetical protein
VSVTICECDAGYFGPDCSLRKFLFLILTLSLTCMVLLNKLYIFLEMCPKGDDPMTKSLNDRKVTLNISSSFATSLIGNLKLEFLGAAVYLPLDNPSAAKCEAALQLASQFGNVKCLYNAVSSIYQSISLIFLNWPSLDSGNNLFSNNGAPSADDFYCDPSLSSVGIICSFYDFVVADISGMNSRMLCRKNIIFFLCIYRICVLFE